MENDLISRKYVESIVKAEFVDLQDGTEEWRTYVNDTCENILNKVDNAPTVDLKDIYQEGHYDGHLEGYTKAINDERPQGEWIREEKTFEDLSGAFETYTRSTCSVCNQANGWGEVPYCPWCGTKMERRHDGHGETNQKQEG